MASRAAVLAGAAGAVIGMLAAWSPALGQDGAAAARVGDASGITGRDFAGLRLPNEPVLGPIEFAARRCRAWTSGASRVLLLSGDALVRLGLDEVSAARAVVWIERIDGGLAAPGTYQVYAYLDRAATPEAAAGRVRLTGDRLRFVGVLSPEDGVVLRADVLEDRGALSGDDARLVGEAEEAFARSLRRLVPGYVEPVEASPFERLPRPLTMLPRGEPGTGRAPSPPADTGTPEQVREALDALPVEAESEPIFATSGVVSVSGKEIRTVSGTDENALMVSGGVVVQYTDRRANQGRGRTLQVTAQRAVAFLRAGRLPEVLGSFTREDCHGIYLEGDVVATDGQYTLRSPRMYYDLSRNRAVVLDAVFWAYDERRGLPLYVRARAIHQESARQFRAESARFANAAFFEPELSVGASTVTITREEAPSGQGAARTLIDAEDITLRAGGVPFFYWPRFRGDPADQPLRDVRVENAAGSGAAIKTRWNAYTLLGIDRPHEVSADLLADFYFERGIGVGGKVGWAFPASRGNVLVYGLPDDSGEDVFTTGGRRSRDGEFRGLVLGEDRWRVDRRWTVSLEAAYVGDEGFVDALFPELAAERREFVNRALATRTEDHTQFALEARGTFNDFLANEYLRQSQGYAVNAAPEARYARIADDVLAGVAPGLVSYTSEYRAGYYGLAFDEAPMSGRGFSDAAAQRAFGISSAQSIADRLRAEGYSEAGIYRFDTRQELSLQGRVGPVNVQPFGVARATLYEDDFAAFAPGGNDELRLWFGGGVRVGTELTRVFNAVDSSALDLHRLRHVVRPSATFFGAGTNIERNRLPVYTDEVESIVDGTMVRVGVDQAFQTQRGAPGRWHEVDVFTLRTHVVSSSSDAGSDGPIGRFYEARPELSNPGDYATADAAWQVTDTFALTAATVYDLDLHQQARTSAGFIIRHSPEYQSYVEAHHLNAHDSTVIALGTQYELTDKYALALGASYDASVGGWQGASVELRRRFQTVLVGGNIAYDNISGQTSFGFVLQPYGAGGSAALAGFGSASPVSRLGGP